MSFFRRRTRQVQSYDSEIGIRKDRSFAHQQSLDWEFGADGSDALFMPPNGRNGSSAGRAPSHEGALPSEPVWRSVITVTPEVSSTNQPLRTAPQVEPAPSSTSPLAQVFRGANATLQVAAVRKALDTALERWWGQSELPATQLLRDGLLILEAGHKLGESQRSLLLRTALARGKGMLTALRYQTDSERTAALLKEALLDLNTQLTPAVLCRLREQDEKSVEWGPLLRDELIAELPTSIGRQRQLAWAGLAELNGRKSPALDKDVIVPSLPLFLPFDYTVALTWSRFRMALLALLMVILVVVYFSRHAYTSSSAAVTIPAGSYVVGGAAGDAKHTVKLTAFVIDQTEVTNRAYRRCYQAGYCSQPSNMDSTTRTNYFLNTEFDDFPVINVDWTGANTFCRWVGKRLPTVDEWEVAAGFAPATQRYYRFPWGDQFDPRLVNGLPTQNLDSQKKLVQKGDNSTVNGLAVQKGANSKGNDTSIQKLDTQPVGFYHPYGDSPFGLADMAGNVAEWTATAAQGAGNTNGAKSYIVKGGSFQDQPDALRNDAQQVVNGATTAPSLGFRCAATLTN